MRWPCQKFDKVYIMNIKVINLASGSNLKRKVGLLHIIFLASKTAMVIQCLFSFTGAVA